MHAIPDSAVEVRIDGVWVRLAQPKRFSTGSVGWYLSDKIDLNGERVQLSLSMTVVGSKPQKDPGQTDKGQEGQNGKPPRKPRKATDEDIVGQIVFGEMSGSALKPGG